MMSECKAYSSEVTGTPALVSFLGALLMEAAAVSSASGFGEAETQEGTVKEPLERRHSIVIQVVTDNARVHPKHSRTCPFRSQGPFPRAVSCPNLNTLEYSICCEGTQFHMNLLTNDTPPLMPRVKSTGSLSSCRWEANLVTCDEKCRQSKQDGAIAAPKPPMRKWTLDDSADDGSIMDNDDEDFGDFVLLSDDETEQPSMDYKHLGLLSSPTSTAIRMQ